MSAGSQLEPVWWERAWLALAGRRRGGRRSRTLRRALAAALILTGGVLAIAPQEGVPIGSAAVVLTRDVAVGATLTATDVGLTHHPAVPDGVVGDPADAVGRTVSGRIRRGELLTDARLVDAAGPDPGPGRVAVPVRPGDPAIADLLAPGVRVAVLAVGEGGSAEMLAADAVVLGVTPRSPGDRDARPVVLAVPAAAADRITATALAGTIALRFA